ncbi:MAG: Uma2 family endonuclease [bacterium]|nr:Uma2 family endonuclease [bacterium]
MTASRPGAGASTKPESTTCVLLRGVLHETMAAGRRHGKIAVNLATELNLFARARRLGTVVASDSGVWLERDPDTVREPDVAYTSAEKIPLDAEIDGYAEVVPDLVIEIVASPRLCGLGGSGILVVLVRCIRLPLGETPETSLAGRTAVRCKPRLH